MVVRLEGECCFATNFRSYKVNHSSLVGVPRAGGGRCLEGGGQGLGWGFHLSLLGLLLPPAAASQPRAFPQPPDHIGRRGAAPQSPAKELASRDEPWSRTVGCVSVSLSSSAPVRGTPLLPAPFLSTQERFPPGGGGAEQGNGCLREVAQIPASLPPAQGLLRRPAPPTPSTPPPPTRGSLSPPPPPGQGKHVTGRWSWEAGGRGVTLGAVT